MSRPDAPSPTSPTDPDAELLALLTLRLTPGLGPRRIENLRRHFGSAQAVLAASLARLREVPGLDSKSLSAVGMPGVGVRAEQELGRAREAGVQVLGRGLAGYPDALEALQDPPAALWVRGPDLPLEVVPRAVGLVGTRAASEHALKLTRQLSGDLARAGVNIVSGLARGIDSAAHQAALDAGGVSTALLGCGVDVIYPAENARLAARLTLVSEYPLGTRPATHHFPQRNRLIAALSRRVGDHRGGPQEWGDDHGDARAGMRAHGVRGAGPGERSAGRRAAPTAARGRGADRARGRRAARTRLGRGSRRRQSGPDPRAGAGLHRPAGHSARRCSTTSSRAAGWT